MRLLIALLVAASPLATLAEPLRIYTARSIITMDESLPRATAVAVAEGRIVAVGDLDSMGAWREARDHVIDHRFADKVLLPGLIDNHLHPLMATMLLNTRWITPQRWSLPGREVEPTRGRSDYLDQVAAAAAEAGAGDEPFITWGYHELWHGVVRRADLDRIAPHRPVILWQRSFHEVVVNSAALQWLGFDPAVDEEPIDVDFEQGLFSERGLSAALGRLVPFLLTPERRQAGLEAVRSIVHQGGVTTIADMGVGMYFGLEPEAALLRATFDGESSPVRIVLVPAASSLPDASERDAWLQAFEDFPAAASPKVRIGRHMKLLADGGFFAQYMRMNPPGYIDGHKGKWLTPPAELEALARLFWDRGYQLHVHVNGDEGMDVVLNILERLLTANPLPDHRTTLHHVGFATNDQLRRAGRLGAVISAQPYYIWALGDLYAAQGLGYDRASQMSRIGAMVRNGIPTSLHSDFTMAPAAPLTLAWVAVNRVTSEGSLMAPPERITVEQALRAVTIDAAFALRMEQEIGSIVAGKRADFTVLEAGPLEVAPMQVKDIPVWGTVFEGRPYPIVSP
ncbi:MAG: amidohydrolase [Gammaproteobacteria bacterium]|nr:amidohydrolase [Gammaproteobacteria bacterium]MYK81684.1 amidohydrolase [Gammaproteobacteria bacterium]